MDLLAGYGSDSDAQSDEEQPQAAVNKPHAAPNSAAGGAKSSPSVPSSFLAAVPPPRSQPLAKAAQPDELELPSSSKGNLFSGKLPQPSGPVKRVVSFQVPLKKELLAKAAANAGSVSDDDDEPATKRFRPSAKKSHLLDSLPAPVNEPLRQPAGRVLGAGAAGPGALGGGGSDDDDDDPLAATLKPGTEGLPPPNFFDAGAEAVHQEPQGNEAYRVADGGTLPAPTAAHHYPAGPSSSSSDHHQHAQAYDPHLYAQYAASDPQYAEYYAQYYAQYDLQAYAQHYAQFYGEAGAQQGGPSGPVAGPHAPGKRAGTGAIGTVGDANGGGGVDLLQEALRAEQERLAKRVGKGGSGVPALKVVEVNQGQLTKMDQAARDASGSLADTLGNEYATKLRSEANALAGNKLARRKHQIGTLLANAKLMELDMMEKRGQSVKTKKETQAKYGWS